ncbi:FecR family protein [Alsobacter sp. R-9]
MFLRGFIALAVSVLLTGPVLAQVIGDAQFIQRDVRGIAAGRLYPISMGDSVYRDQIVRTFAESSAVLSFLDKSLMSIGPQSEVRLDEFVFRGGTGPRTVEAVKGFFRFISGTGPGGHDYQVRTPHATIAVRGTTFDVRVGETGTTVVLHEGAVDVCAAGQCRSMVPGQIVDASRTGVGGVRTLGAGDWTFGSDKGQRAAAAAKTFADARAAARPALVPAAALAATVTPDMVVGAPEPAVPATVVTLAPAPDSRAPVRMPDAVLPEQPQLGGGPSAAAGSGNEVATAQRRPAEPVGDGVRMAGVGGILRTASGLRDWSSALVAAVTIAPAIASEPAWPLARTVGTLCIAEPPVAGAPPGIRVPSCSWPVHWSTRQTVDPSVRSDGTGNR